MVPRLIRYGSKRVAIIQFSPKLVYGRCLEAKKIGDKHCSTFKFVKNQTKLIRNILEKDMDFVKYIHQVRSSIPCRLEEE